MSSLEFAEWMEFYKLEPFGRDAEFQGHAMTSAMVFNMHKGEKTKAINVSDLMPKDPEPPQSIAQMKQFATMMTMAMGGSVKEKHGH